MGLIGMSEAARRMGVSNATAARRSLQNAGVELVAIHPRAMAVEESDLAAYIQRREAAGGFAKGRPEGTTKNSEGTTRPKKEDQE